jgi:biopolymer transport protein ExbD
MLKFLLYLLESGLCLSILFLVYLVLFRKETYFQFNRVYLISIIFISALIPFMHFSFNIDDTNKYETYFAKLGEIKSSYEQVLVSTNLVEPNNITNESENIQVKSVPNESDLNEISENSLSNKSNSTNSKWSFNYIVFIIYLLGALYLISRFIVLLHWIIKTLQASIREKHYHYSIIKVEQDIAPFSFLKYIFINDNSVNSDQAKQIIEHEKIHIRQGHTIDLFLIHIFCILHWYNPLVWIMLKAIKTNHEFITDSKVLSKGYDMLDYQELLLKQFISFPTIKIANNLNLTSIKNRIKMMNKFKSGKLAQLKPIFIIPIALFVFVLFSNLTINSSNNYALFNNDIVQLKGMWKNNATNTYGKYILFEDSKFSILEEFNSLKEFPYQISDNKIIINMPNNKDKVVVKYEFIDESLKIWWGNNKVSEYTKSEYDNTLDDYVSEFGLSLNLPKIDNYKIIQRTELCINVIVTENNYIVNGKRTSIENLKETLLEEKANNNAIYKSYVTVNIYNDENISMNMVTDLKQTLREADMLKIFYMGIAKDNKVSKLESRYVGIPRKLPPLFGTNEAEIIQIVPDTTTIN